MASRAGLLMMDKAVSVRVSAQIGIETSHGRDTVSLFLFDFCLYLAPELT
jgi:hypothetical protein